MDTAYQKLQNQNIDERITLEVKIERSTQFSPFKSLMAL